VQTIFLFFRIASSKNELFLAQNLIPQQALTFEFRKKVELNQLNKFWYQLVLIFSKIGFPIPKIKG